MANRVQHLNFTQVHCNKIQQNKENEVHQHQTHSERAVDQLIIMFFIVAMHMLAIIQIM